MEKTEKIWLNGKLVNWDDAKVHILSHAFNYGTGVFEGIRVYQTPKGPAVFRLKDHVKRLMEGCKIMGIDLVFEATVSAPTKPEISGTFQRVALGKFGKYV